MTDVQEDMIRTEIASLDGEGLPVAVRANRRLEWAQVLPPLLPPALHGLDDRLSRLAVYQRWRRSSLGTWLFGQRQLDLVGLEESGLVRDLRYDPFAITREIDTEQIRRAWALTGPCIRGSTGLAHSPASGCRLVIH